MTTTNDSGAPVVKTRRRRSAEERRTELTNRLTKLDQRESNRVVRRLAKVEIELAEIAKMPGLDAAGLKKIVDNTLAVIRQSLGRG
jgi:predicted nuclease of restriction endonuclease-like RecB superfamily